VHPLISIVITTYNRSDALALVIQGLAAQTDRNFEVVIADDGSTADHQLAIGAACQHFGLQAVHMWHPDVGFTASRARNRGVSLSRGDYLIFLDGDCVPERDFVQRHRSLMQPVCFVNGSRVLLSQRLTDAALHGHEPVVGLSAARWLSHWAHSDASKLTGLMRLPDGKYRIQRDFMWRGIRSCNMAVWRADFEAVNGFDESFVGWGHEDADFVLRLHNHGVMRKNGFCATEVYHLWHREASRSTESVNAQRVRDRILTGTVLPDSGFAQSRNGVEVVHKTLG